ncbi:hypothetical protein, partial [Candidatus Halocynthiibacter alkanivorans]|uniref:hypothetical protein n=1 Tax=Candidatus Halocynthiibacter alkanivorans TaxID=2267619 RepID=UPI001F446E4F
MTITSLALLPAQAAISRATLAFCAGFDQVIPACPDAPPPADPGHIPGKQHRMRPPHAVLLSGYV